MTSSPRLLFVHAHPDDESILTGATMAHYAASGAEVTLVTCTLGEQGEILVPALAGLEAARADQLGGYRMGELTAALAALGVHDHRWLGGAGRFRDSGMRGTPAAGHPRAFARADAEVAGFDPAAWHAAVGALVEVLLELRPHVVVTYDEFGDYGHPDHVLTHRVTMAALEAAASEGWTAPKVYWTATTTAAQQRDHEIARADGMFDAVPPAELGYGVDDALVTTVIDASASLAAKTAALLAHRTQVLVGDGVYALSNRQGRALSGVERYRLVRGRPGGPLDADGRETDLLGGLDAG